MEVFVENFVLYELFAFMFIASRNGVNRQLRKHGIWGIQKATIVTANQLRSQFLDYFKSKNHEILPGSSVIPEDDPSLLFVNAGMNQFKKYYLGDSTP